MDLGHTKRTAAAAWILGSGVVGLAANVSSIPASVLLAVLGFGPPLVVLLWWNHPPRTMTESIQQTPR